jgi:trk system potassium uptake protein TrkH
MSAILKYLGKMVFIAGVFTLVPAVASVLLGEGEVGINFILPALPSILLGYLLDRRYPSDELGLTDAFIVAALGWLLVPLIGSLPFFMTLHAGPLDAYFESISGFTTTGLEKAVLIFHMWAGRLEIIPLLVLLSNLRERVSFHLISQPTKGS